MLAYPSCALLLSHRYRYTVWEYKNALIDTHPDVAATIEPGLKTKLAELYGILSITGVPSRGLEDLPGVQSPRKC